MITNKMILIQNYINGESIDPYDLDYLENNKKFMLKVLKTTKDENMYYFCSEELKEDYIFIKEVINIFKDDLAFVTKIGEERIEKTGSDEEKIDLLVTLKDLTTSHQDYIEQNINYGIMLHAEYISKRTDIEACKIKLQLDDELGLGFSIITEDYENESVKKFIAESMIREIFYELNKDDLETIMHNELTKEQLQGLNKNTYLINILRSYDKDLSFYVSNNLKLLEEQKKNINTIIKNWNNYINNEIEDKGERVYEAVNNYMDENINEFPYPVINIIYSIASELDKLDIIKAYDADMEQDEVFKSIIENNYIDKSNMNFIQLTHYRNIKYMMQEILMSKGNIQESTKKNQEKGCKVYTFTNFQNNQKR